jgi:outer membrane autotransporter protein
MSESKNQAASAQRRNARVIQVAPVTRAIRAALAVSATTLALTASGSLFASNCVAPMSTSIQCDGGSLGAVVQEAATHPVFDLTTVRGDDALDRVVPARQQLRVSSADLGSAITSLGDVRPVDEFLALDAVQDLVAIDGLTPGPGGVSGSDDSIYIDASGTTSLDSTTGVFAGPSSDYGIADFVFAASDHFTYFTNNAAISASGNTWAAGFELEAATYANGIRNSSTGSITTSASGQNGQAWGIYAVGVDEVHVYNDGAIDVSASGKYGTATGLFSYSPDGIATADNTGSIAATADANGGHAWGIYAAGVTGASITNAGDVSANAGSSYVKYGSVGATATGLAAYSAGGTATVSNSVTGSIAAYAEGKYGQAFGIYAAGDAGASVDNAGRIVAEAYGPTGPMGSTGNAIGISAFSSAGDIDLSNRGSVFAGADGDATALRGYATTGDVSIDNAGDVFAYSESGNAIGIYGYSIEGDVRIVNSGSVGAYSYYGLADGIFASGVSVDVANTSTGAIDAIGYTWAAGIEAQGSDLTSVTNDGTITAFAYAGNYVDRVYGYAFGIYATAGTGGASIENTGGITVDGAYSNGIYALAEGSITIGNSADINVGTTYAQYATGIHAATSGDNGSIDVVNSGNIVADSQYGAVGIEVVGTGNGSTGNVANSGNIYVDHATFFGTDATGIVVSTDGNASADNSGLVIASSGGSAYGVIAQSFNGDASVTNSGDVGAYSTLSYSGAYGLIAFSQNGGAIVDNSGNVVASSSFNGGYLAMGIQAIGTAGAGVTNSGSVATDAWYAYGISASSGLGDVVVSNTGSGIVAVEGVAFSLGVLGLSIYGDVAIDNAAEISSYAYGQAVGTFARSTHGDVASANSGYIEAFSVYGPAVATFASADEGSVAIDNSGLAQAASPFGDAIGIRAFGLSVDVANTGSVQAVSVYGVATGIDVYGTDSTTVGNDGVVNAGSKYGNAQGIYAVGGGDVSVGNGADGIIGTYADTGFALGVMAYSIAGNSAIDNAGDVVAAGYGGALGLYAGAYGDATITNSGSVTVDGVYGNADAVSGYSAMGDVSLGNSGVIEAYSQGGSATGMTGVAAAGDVEVHNSGTIEAYSYSGAFAIGAFGIATVGDVVVANAGSIYSGAGYDAFGVFASAGDGNATAVNSGNVHAYSYGATAQGIFVDAINGDALVDNSGSIDALSPHGAAIGIYGSSSGGLLSVTTSGDITATGRQAFGVLAYGYTAGVTNAGTIDALVTDAGGLAAGVVVQGNAGALVANTGTISAESVPGSDAIGVIALAYGNVLVDNAGLITATDDDYAVAVNLDSTAGTAILRNSGILRTYSTIEGQVAVLGGDGVQQVLNDGDIYGAIVTGAGDDVMVNGNAGTWHVANHSTDFGDGDDSITNAAGGTILLSNGAIHLGASGSAGNTLTNNGVLQVRGHSLIDMGTAGSALTNNGVVDFADGAPNDVLTIIGDLAGNGAIDLDINTLDQTTDLMYVDGSVVDGAAQIVNLNIASLPTTMHVDPIDFAFVSGDSTASSFVGGGVIGFGTGNFLDLQVTVTSRIDASNTTDDVFSVGLDVAGLNDTGSLAASIASGAQSLINSQVGTWRQRMGVLPAKGQDAVGLSPWIRFFSDKGEVDPTHTANFGAGGNFRYDQSNTGNEFGVNVNIRGGLNIGLLLANSEGTQRLLDPGVGTNRMDGSAFGLYTTWIGSNGFYVDTSYRWLDFDVDLTSEAGLQSTRAKGNAFNVEAGYTAWTVGGIDITPQLQYTRSSVGNIDTLRGDRVEFVANGGDSSRARLGVSLSKTIGSVGWIWTPYGSVNAVREFDGQTSYTVADTFSGSTSTEGTSAMVELGLGAQKNGLSITGGANWLDGGALQSFVGGQVVLRYSW